LEADAERTFKNPLLRQDMVGMLFRVADGDYHQGLGYLAGACVSLVCVCLGGEGGGGGGGGGGEIKDSGGVDDFCLF